ncbi:hypothetical protein JZ751_002061 [Albula glossodonta]|uniref:Uncharacterized protein n=1 Tax=Albula glossodonta TaxID=121402 RepID=A0A8T2P9E1_9TELE|nr:hypothetical protein JZ751_002061 [Albula glossodonta]
MSGLPHLDVECPNTPITPGRSCLLARTTTGILFRCSFFRTSSNCRLASFKRLLLEPSTTNISPAVSW